MIELGYVLLIAAKVILMFILIYIFIPSRLIRFQDEDRFLDRVFISLTHSTFLVIIVVHFLAFLKLYETFSLVIVYPLLFFLFNRLKGRPPAGEVDTLKTKILFRLFDWSESRDRFKNVKQNMGVWVRQHKNKAFIQLKTSLTEPFSGIFPVLTVMGAAYIRFKDTFIHAAYLASDPYVHLIWVKLLGNNQMYSDGIYPYGFHAIISNMVKLTFLDPYWICRFIGPLAGVLLTLSVYYFALRVTKSYPASLISLVFYGLVINGIFPLMIARQTAALPQEFAAIFILPGLYFLWVYLKSRNRLFLLLFAESLVITVMIHSYAAVYLIIWAAVLTLLAILFKRLNLKVVFNVFIYSLLAGMVSLLPFGIGLLMGREFFTGATGFIQKSIIWRGFPGSLTDILTHLNAYDPFFQIALLIVLLMVISTVVVRKNDWAVLSLTVSGCSVIMYLLYRAPELGLPQITHPSRTEAFLTPMFAVLYGCGLNVVEKCIPDIPVDLAKTIKKRLIQVISIALCLVTIYGFTPGKIKVRFQEYDAAAENYLSISSKFPIFDWTIISPTEQFQQVMGRGWHQEILRFVQEFNLEQARDPQFIIPIPTQHIFFYTEKKPLYLGREVTAEDAERALEPEGENPFDQYYLNADQRAIIEAKAIRWMEAYRKSHQGVSIFYEDDNLKIYHIYHNPKKIPGRV